VHVAAEAVGKRLEHHAREVREDAVGEAGDRVLLVDDERPARQPGGDPAGSADEAAEADDDQRLVAPHDPERLHQRHRQAKRGGEPGEHALAAKSRDRQPLEGNALGRNEARLEPALGAEPHDLEGPLAQQARQRQGRKHVTAGAARHDEDRAAHHRPSRCPLSDRTVAEPRASSIASW
jgi:hypothetical protein